VGCSSITAWWALWFRQTNVLWAGFLIVLEVGRRIKRLHDKLVDSERKAVTGKATATSGKATGKRRRGKKRRGRAEIEEKRMEEGPEASIEAEMEDGPWTIDIKSNGNVKGRGSKINGYWRKVLEVVKKVQPWNPVFDDEVTAQGIPLSMATSFLSTNSPPRLLPANPDNPPDLRNP